MPWDPCRLDDADLALARSRLGDASRRLADAAVAAAGLAALTAWSTPAQRRFTDAVESWRGEVSRLAVTADGIRDDLWWVQLHRATAASTGC